MEGMGRGVPVVVGALAYYLAMCQCQMSAGVNGLHHMGYVGFYWMEERVEGFVLMRD